jgi:hypothetical protein
MIKIKSDSAGGYLIPGPSNRAFFPAGVARSLLNKFNIFD